MHEGPPGRTRKMMQSEEAARIDCGSPKPPGERRHTRSASARPEWDGIDIDACYRYILGRQTIDGGFCFYVYHDWGVEEPNAPDAYAAVASLGLLDRPVPRRAAVADWLKAQQDPRGGYATLTIAHATLTALRLLGEAPLRDPSQFLENVAGIYGLTDAAGREPSGWLHNGLRCVELWQDYGLSLNDRIRTRVGAALSRLRQDDGGYGAPGASLPDTGAAVALAAALDLPVDPAVLAYVRQCEAPPYGFNITPSASSSGLESHHAGLRVLGHFGASPRQPAVVQDYVESCQTRRGGFGRVPGAVPRLDDSLRALEVLCMLAQARSAGRQASGDP
jgi:hypothetical protein